MSLIKNVATLGSWTFAYRISSLARDKAICYFLGAGVFADAFSVAFKLANILRKLFAEGSFNASFLPIFSSCLKDRGHEDAKKLASQVMTLLTIILTILTIFSLIYFDKIIGAYQPGYKSGTERFNQAVILGRICFPYIATSFFAALFGAILNTLNKFAMPVAVQLFMNIFVMIAVVMGAMHFPSVAYTMAWGTLISGVFQMLLLYLNISKYGYRLSIVNCFNPMPEVKAIFSKLISGAVGSGVWQLNIIIDFIMVSFLPTGGYSYIYCTDHLNQFAIGILGIVFSTALLPSLTRAIKDKNYQEANGQLNLGFLFALIFTLPTTAIFIALHHPITDIVYGGGQFGPEHVRAAAPAFAAFAVGLPSYMIMKVLSTTFFAYKDTKTPFNASLICMGGNILFILLLTPFMKHIGIALATSIGSWLSIIYLIVKLKSLETISVTSDTWRQFFMQILCSIVMLFVLYVMNNIFVANYVDSILYKLFGIMCMIMIGSGVFYACGKILGLFNFVKKIKELGDA